MQLKLKGVFQKYVKSIRLRPGTSSSLETEMFQKYVKSIRLRPLDLLES